MSRPGTDYSKGNLLKDYVLNALVNNRVVDGIVQEGQAAYVTTKIIEESNNFYEARGTGNKRLDTYEDKVAYLGDPTIRAQVQSAVAVVGGVRINFSQTSYDAYRVDDNVDTKFAGNQAKVVETGPGYIVVAQRLGFSAPITGDYPVGASVIQRSRAIDATGTKAPVSVNPVPKTWSNFLSIIDDGGQDSLFTSLNRTNIQGSEEYMVNVTTQYAAMRFFSNQSATYWTSRAVNPETNGFQFTATDGIINQIKTGGTYVPLSSLITKTEFERRLRSFFLSNPGNSMDNRIIKTGSIGMALISEWYKDELRYDKDIAVTFTDGSVNGLNATKIFIPGFGAINVVKDVLQDMDLNGELSSLSGFTDLPKTSGDFYFLDFSPVMMQDSGMLAPAFQKIYLKEKYFYAMEKGLSPISSLGAITTSGKPLTLANLEMTSTTNDFDSFRMWSACGINVLNRSAHAYLENLV